MGLQNDLENAWRQLYDALYPTASESESSDRGLTEAIADALLVLIAAKVSEPNTEILPSDRDLIGENWTVGEMMGEIRSLRQIRNDLLRALKGLIGVGQIAANIRRERGEVLLQAEYQLHVDEARSAITKVERKEGDE